MSVTKDFDILCSACETIFDETALCLILAPEPDFLSISPYSRESIEESPSEQPHLTLRSLVASVEEGCHLCSLILGSLKCPPCRDNKIECEKISEAVSSAGITQLITHVERHRLHIWGKLPYQGHYLDGVLELSPASTRDMYNLIRGRLSRPETFPEPYLAEIFRWTESCIGNHEACSNHSKYTSAHRRLPTRILDVGSNHNEQFIRLRTTESMDIDIPYVTLSHRWGGKTIKSLSASTLLDFKRSISLSSLPRTFRDAVQVVRYCGYRYLWIDSLCIFQSGEGREEDWERESALMGGVYSHAILNISATAAADGDGGLFHRNDSRKTQPCTIIGRLDDGRTYPLICHPPRIWETNMQQAPISKRGWVLQERILSPRILHMAAGQMFWECCQERAAEFLPSCSVDSKGKNLKSWPAASKNSEEDDERNHQVWWEIVQTYSSCDLTNPMDKLPAISGLARRTCRQLRFEDKEYLAGLFAPDLPGALLWRSNRWLGEKHVRVPARAPSWSWASVDGPVEFPAEYLRIKELKKNRTHARFLGGEVAMGNDPFGRVAGGHIRLQAPIIPFKVEEDTSRVSDVVRMYEGTVWDATGSAPTSGSIGFLLVFSWLQVGEEHSFFGDVGAGLVIQRTGHKGQFRRLGMFRNNFWNLETWLGRMYKREEVEEEWHGGFEEGKGFVVEIV